MRRAGAWLRAWLRRWWGRVNPPPRDIAVRWNDEIARELEAMGSDKTARFVREARRR